MKLSRSVTISQKIYFDESGFTGTNLLNQNQTVFTYAAVGLDNKKAEELISIIKTNYPTQAQELKFKNYSKSSKCEDFCLFVINLLKDYSRVVVFDKKFALCAKFFEYMFEPAIQLADLLAGIASHAYSRQNSKVIDALVNNNLIASAVIPRTIEMQIVNLYPKEYEKILDMLVKRSIANKSLFDYEMHRLLWILSESWKEVLKIHKARVEENIMSQIS